MDAILNLDPESSGMDVFSAACFCIVPELEKLTRQQIEALHSATETIALSTHQSLRNEEWSESQQTAGQKLNELTDGLSDNLEQKQIIDRVFDAYVFIEWTSDAEFFKSNSKERSKLLLESPIAPHIYQG